MGSWTTRGSYPTDPTDIPALLQFTSEILRRNVGVWCEDWTEEDLPDHGTLPTPIIRGIRDVDGKLIAGTAQTDLLTLWLHHSSGNESKPYYVGRVEFTPEQTDTYHIVAGAHTGYIGHLRGVGGRGETGMDRHHDGG